MSVDENVDLAGNEVGLRIYLLKLDLKFTNYMIMKKVIEYNRMKRSHIAFLKPSIFSTSVLCLNAFNERSFMNLFIFWANLN